METSGRNTAVIEHVTQAQAEAESLAEEFREAVKPCPVCGQQPEIERIDHLVWVVRCECGVVFNPDPEHVSEALNRAAAARTVELWNERAGGKK